MTVGRLTARQADLAPAGRARFGLMAANFAPFFDPDPPPPSDPPKDDLIPRAEAKKAFEARDKAKKEADELRTRLATIEQAEKDREAKAEEERLKKAGEWEAMKQTLVSKHTTELEAERKACTQLEQSYRQEKIEAAFLAATDLFGGHDGSKTILTGDMANAYLGKYVSYEEVEVAGKPVQTIVVRDPDGNILLDGKGNPAKFAEAISELINQLPTKDRILRGSGKTGSGSSGGSTSHSQPVDLRNLTPARLKDPKVIEALKAARPASGITMGAAFQK
jgi:hypothetical protein